MFWRNWSWPTRILSVVFVGLVAAVLSAMFASSRHSRELQFPCVSRLKQVGLGLLQYQQDYNDTLPSAAANGTAYGWADALLPYTRSTEVFQCPTEGNDGQTDPHLSGYTDYWFNAALSRRAMKTISNPSDTFACGDGNDGTDLTNARYSVSALPPQWISDPHSPLHRHNDYGNYLFADGHVKAQKADSLVGTFKP